MNINLKQYQETAVSELIATIKTLLTKEGEKKVCVFQAPTGSGKTLMTAKFIEEIIKELPEVDLCFVWVSIGKGELHLQSKRSLEKVFDGSPKVSLVEEEFSGGRERIVRNEIVVVNWEKLRSKDRETDGSWRSPRRCLAPLRSRAGSGPRRSAGARRGVGPGGRVAKAWLIANLSPCVAATGLSGVSSSPGDAVAARSRITPPR